MDLLKMAQDTVRKAQKTRQTARGMLTHTKMRDAFTKEKLRLLSHPDADKVERHLTTLSVDVSDLSVQIEETTLSVSPDGTTFKEPHLTGIAHVIQPPTGLSSLHNVTFNFWGVEEKNWEKLGTSLRKNPYPPAFVTALSFTCPDGQAVTPFSLPIPPKSMIWLCPARVWGKKSDGVNDGELFSIHLAKSIASKMERKRSAPDTRIIRLYPQKTLS